MILDKCGVDDLDCSPAEVVSSAQGSLQEDAWTNSGQSQAISGYLARLCRTYHSFSHRDH